MPAVSAPAKVLVSGANGYIAVWVVRTLLERGYSIRGTVRSESKGTHLLNLFKDEVKSGKFELVIVPDITAPGAFDEAVKGVDAIEHTSSPFLMSADDPNELIDPAVKGTVGMLESALKFAGPQLKRVVVTSSTASITDHFEADNGLLNESSWNERSIIEVREKGREASQPGKYLASKVLAEKAAWEFVKKNSSELTWDFVTLCPPFVFGPLLHEVLSPSALGTSTSMFYHALLSKMPEGLAELQNAWVDVRDVAEGHVRSLEVPSSGGQRFILSGGEFIWQDWFDAANELKIPGLTIPVGDPGKGKNFQFNIRFDSTKARTVLGMKFHDRLTTAKDSLEDFKARGW